MNAIFCRAIENIPAMVGDTPGRGQVERLKYSEGKLVPTGELFEGALNVGQVEICAGPVLMAKFVDGVLAIDFEAFQVAAI